MATNILIKALGQAIFESCGQALIIYLSLQIFWQLFQGIGAKYRYRINYAALVTICGWFLINLLCIYLHGINQPQINHIINIKYIGTATVPVPTLLQQAEMFIGKYAGYITGLYMIGLLLHMFKLLGGLVNIHYIKKQKNLSADSMWSTKAYALAKDLNIVKKVSLYFSEHVHVPLTIGHLKPIIIFPIALINNLEQEQVEAILLHELAHIKRHDYLLNIVQCLIETILCFNPFVWLLSKTIREEREYCCDDIVVNADCNNYTYAQALFIIAQKNNEIYALAMASTGAKKYPLLNRIKRLNSMKKNDSLPKFHLLAVVAIAFVGILLAWGIPQYGVAKAAARKAMVVTHPLTSIGLAVPSSPKTVTIKALPLQKKKLYTIYADNTTDTLKPGKNRFKIVVQDDKGNKKEFNSVDELPATDKEEFLQENPAFSSLKGIDSLAVPPMIMSPQLHEQIAKIEKMGKKIEAQFNSPQWKKQQKAIEKQALAMNKQFNSREWKKQQEEWNKQAEIFKKQYEDNPEWKKQQDEWKKQAEELQKQYTNSPEWQKQQGELMRQAEEIKKQYDTPEFKKQLADMKKQQAIIMKQYNSPGFKKQEADMKKYFNSPEWKKQVAEMKRQAAEIKKQFNSPEWKKQMAEMQKGMNEGLKKAQADSVKEIN